MARVEIAAQSWGLIVDQFGNSLAGVSVSITKASDGTPATHYSAVTGGTSSTAALVSQSDGTLPDFIDDGQYIVTPAGKPSRRVEAVSATVSGPLDVTKSPYNVLPGVSSASATRLGINQAITDASTRTDGPRAISLPAGTYTVDLVRDPDSQTIAAGVWLRSGVAVLASPGATVKLQDNAMMPASCVQANLVCTTHPYTQPGFPQYLKGQIYVDNLVVDCNGNNNTTLVSGAPLVQAGIALIDTDGGWITKCKVKGLFGNSGSPPGETFHFEFNNSTNCHALFCEADGSTSTSAASGFSADNSFDCSWTNCKSHGMTYGQGFTNWQSAGLRYNACHSYSNAGAGFNNERSENIVFTACIAGGRSPLIGNGNYENPYYPSGQTALGNTGDGFLIQGCKDVHGHGNISRLNGSYGIYVKSNTAVTAASGTATTTNGSPNLTSVSPTTGWVNGQAVLGTGIPAGTVISSGAGTATMVMSANATASASGVAITGRTLINSDIIMFSGGDVSDNTLGPTFHYQPSTAFKQTNVFLGPFKGRSVAAGGTDQYLTSYFARTPFFEYKTDSNDGVRFITNVGAGGASSTTFGFLLDTGEELFRSNGAQQFSTHGRIRAVRSVATDTTVTLADDIINTTSTSAARTHTLPAVSGAAAGTTFTFVDGSAAASTSFPITVNSGSDLIGGLATRAITTPGGVLTVVSTGSTWIALDRPKADVRVPLRSGLYHVTANATAATTSTLTNSRLYLHRFIVPRDRTFVRLGAEVTAVGTAGCTVRLGVYNDDGDGFPASLRYDAGASGSASTVLGNGLIDGGTASVQEVTISLPLPSGIYWVGGVVQGTPASPPTMRIVNHAADVVGTSGLPSGGGGAVGYAVAGVTGALPSSFTGSAGGDLALRTFVKTA